MEASLGSSRLIAVLAILACHLAGHASACDAEGPTGHRVSRALRKAVQFYSARVAVEGGYHAVYAADLSFARSAKRGQGGSQISVTSAATPSVGMAMLIAWSTTGDRFYLKAARAAGEGLLRGQLCSGGWDYTIQLDPSLRGPHRYRVDVGARKPRVEESVSQTNLDNNTTQAALRFLMRLDRELGFADAAVHDGVRFALEGLIQAQYPNGAWPQRFRTFPDPARYPVKRAAYPEQWPRTWPGPDFLDHYTINDECTLNMIDVLLEASRIYDNSAYLEAAQRGGNFLVLAQMPDPQPAWAQQYDADMYPAWARIFEPPAVSGRESMDVIRTLLLLYQETGQQKYLAPIPRALDYLDKSVLPAAKEDRRASRRLARFYELRTNRPLYITKGSRLWVGDAPGKLVGGYTLTYEDDHIVSHYSLRIGAEPLPVLRRQYERIRSADRQSLKRPLRLTSLTPWKAVGSTTATAPTRAELGDQVQRLLESLDERGAWVQEGEIVRADRLIGLTAGKNMTVVIGDQVLPLREDQTLQIFESGSPPQRRVIHSGTFAANVRTLCAYLAGVTAQNAQAP